MATEIQTKARRDPTIGILSLLVAVVGLLNPRELLLPTEGLAAILGLAALVTGGGRAAGGVGLALSVLLLVAGPEPRPRRPNSAARAAGDLKLLHSSEIAYASVADGRYGSLTCLREPSSVGCVAGYPSTAPKFLNEWVPPGAYEWTFVGMPAAGPSFERFCIQARPRELSEDADSSLGIDETGTLVRYAGLTDCCGTDGTRLPVCTPVN